jgi:hypothetical protein
MSRGDQIEAGGSDVTLQQINVVSKEITPSMFENQPTEELAHGSYNPSDPNISADYQQAFADNTTAGTIRNAASDALGGSTIAGALCSPVGIITQAVVGLFAGFASVVADAGSFGALTPATVGLWAAKEGVTFAISAVAMHFVQGFILNKTTEGVLAKAAISNGPLIAYGAREAANIASIGTGGTSLSNQESTAFAKQEMQTEQRQFESESLFARVFNVNDSRSLFGHLAEDISPDFSQNAMTLSQNLLNIGSIFNHALGSFADLLPKASADSPDSTVYNWEFAQFGIPSALLNDPDLADPATNATDAAQILDNNCLSSGTLDTSCSYAQRIDECFGNTLTYTNGMWDVQKDHDVDTHSDDYASGDCGDIGTDADTQKGDAVGDWRRIIMFTFDTHTMKAAACYATNDAQSCADEGQST